MTSVANYSSAFALALLAGCATCREHPVVCSAAVAVVAGSVALAVHRERGERQAMPHFERDPRGPMCRQIPGGPVCP